MNIENLKLWQANLRSGEYPQGTGSLQSHNGTYCCLGVLCETAIANGVEVDKKEDKEDYDCVMTYDGDEFFPSPNIMDWVGIDVYTCTQLIDMNDDQNKTFEEIADYLETKYIKEQENE